VFVNDAGAGAGDVGAGADDADADVLTGTGDADACSAHQGAAEDGGANDGAGANAPDSVDNLAGTPRSWWGRLFSRMHDDRSPIPLDSAAAYMDSIMRTAPNCSIPLFNPQARCSFAIRMSSSSKLSDHIHCPIIYTALA
jgi:hypothetical protein